MQLSIDVVIPTFRLDEQYLLPILDLKIPKDTIVRFFLLADNPAVKPTALLSKKIQEQNATLIINRENIGAPANRNKGIEAGNGDWILFLDDDISVKENLLEIYAKAIREYPSEIGFIGLTKLPEASTAFAKAIEVTGSMDIFSIAEHKSSHAWGATANIMINREAIGEIRFSTQYPKAGGGEDIDFFLKVRKQNNFRNYKTLPEAVVQHPWWNNGNPDFKKPFRYGKGNSWLGELNPKYTYRDFLNTPETILLLLACLVMALLIKQSWIVNILFMLIGALVIEILAVAVQTIKRHHSFKPKIIYYVALLRFVYECGLLYGNISRGRFAGIGERFHDDGKIKKIFFYRTNTHKLVKWVLYPLLIFYLFTR